jgi:hypothetical protein
MKTDALTRDRIQTETISDNLMATLQDYSDRQNGVLEERLAEAT